MRVHLWAPGFDSAAGGIQAYSAQVRQALLALGHECVSFEFRGSRMRFLCAVLQGYFVRRPDLILATHLHFSPIARFLKRTFRTPYAVSLHGIEAWELSRNRDGVQEADLLLPVSAYTRDRVLEKLSAPVPRTEILFNTVDSLRFQVGAPDPALRRRFGFADDAPLILTVGRLSANEAYKGQDSILRALPRILSRHPKAAYLIVGEGDDRPRLETLVRDLGLTERVGFAGKVPANELAACYQSCDVFAMPSRGEGFGIVYLEAMACGRPVIAGTGDAGRDALDGGQLGCLVDPSEPSEVADALIRCLNREPEDALMFHPSRLRGEMLARFGPESFRERLESILRSL